MKVKYIKKVTNHDSIGLELNQVYQANNNGWCYVVNGYILSDYILQNNFEEVEEI